MYKIIAIVGEAGCGKDTILNKVIDFAEGSLNPIISCTTRPPREGERDGINYYFLDKDTFADKILNDEMLEASCFNNWLYGTAYSALSEDKVNIGVFNPEGIENISLDKKVKLYVYRIKVSDKIRLIRQLNREENPNIPEIIRRLRTDWEDFSELNFYYNEIPNETDAELEDAVSIILEDAKKIGKYG